MILFLVLPLVLCDRSLSQEICLDGDFDSQVQWFVENVMFSSEDKAQIRRVLDDVKTTMQRQWPGTEVIPHGSAAMGVGIKTSDVDCYVKIPNFNTSADLYVLTEATALLQLQRDMFSDMTCELLPPPADSSLLTFRHRPTGRLCDVIFTNNSIYQTSALNRYYFNLNEKFKPLVAIIKYWFQVQELNKKTIMRSFHLYLLIIFYLQQINMVPPVFRLQNKQRHFEGLWDLSFDEIPYNSTNTDISLYRLLTGFFTYYSEFNFDDYIVSPYAGRPIRKIEFLGNTSVSGIFYLYKKNMRESGFKPLDVERAICIQDMFVHNVNTAARVSRRPAALLRARLRDAARLSAHGLLTALFTNPQHKELLNETNLSIPSCNNATDM
ncbi:terminal uridylyltransferase Tailor-like [Trichoplusia ni]|uniref:Terminal uridylyltransferase Tailor-like n=1 Tax=Trichoplusia ni TaxID=7111 RepID=A0A7E5VPQ0_TRINI|nr:terminal uridylyltransferase Tailor-like [Trichoplusia ni]